MSDAEVVCPRCGNGCWRESADTGVGVIHGPFGCPGCGWSEWLEYDLDNPERAPFSDQWGGVYPGHGQDTRGTLRPTSV